jgi:hypothetical protein
LTLFKKDTIKNALTKNKNPLRKYKKRPKKYKVFLMVLKNTKNTKKTPKITIWPLFSFLRSFCNVWGLFCIIWGGFLYFLRGKTVEQFLYFLGGFCIFWGEKIGGDFVFFGGIFGF